MTTNHLPEKHEVSEKAKDIGARVNRRVVLRLLEDRDLRIAQLEAENKILRKRLEISKYGCGIDGCLFRIYDET